MSKRRFFLNGSDMVWRKFITEEDSRLLEDRPVDNRRVLHLVGHLIALNNAPIRMNKCGGNDFDEVHDACRVVCHNVLSAIHWVFATRKVITTSIEASQHLLDAQQARQEVAALRLAVGDVVDDVGRVKHHHLVWRELVHVPCYLPLCRCYTVETTR